MKIIGNYKDLYIYISENKEKLVDYLTKNLSRNSLVNYGYYDILDIKSDEDKLGNITLHIISISSTDHKKYLKGEFPHSYQTHASINFNGDLTSSQTNFVFRSMSENEMPMTRDISEYILEFWATERRDNRIGEIISIL